MKRLFVLTTALLALVAFSAPAFASNQVQLTLTSPTIYKSGCEKAGSVTFSFDQGSQIAAGDWWYMDLPSTVTLCKTLDYVIVQQNGTAAGNSDVTLNASLDYSKTIFNAGTALNVGTIVEGLTGPLTTSKVDASAGAIPLTNGVTNNIAFLVKGVEGQRRVTLYALSDATFDKVTVANGWKMNIKILDGQAHSNLTADASTAILLDSDGDKTYGETAANNAASTTKAEVIGGVNTADGTAGPYVENTLCVNAEKYDSTVVMTSYASKSDKFTFTGDAQIAHTATSGSIALKTCTKFADTGSIKIAGQGSTCTFDYDTTPLTGANTNYCATPAFLGNRLMIEASTGAFGDIDDTYDVTAEIVTTGVYFTNAISVVAFTSAQDECDSTTVGSTSIGAGTFVPYIGTTLATNGYAPSNTCTIPTNRQVNKIVSTNGSFDLDNFDTIQVDMPLFAYDQSKVSDGTEIQVKLSLTRYPCGEIFTATKTIGTFVTACGTSATSNTLYLPWFPGTGAAGWWGGYVITNFGKTAGTIKLTYADADGKTATYTTASVAAGAQWNAGSIDFSKLTDVDGFDSTKNYSVKAECGFTAQGFAFTGNGKEGTGYLGNK